MNFHEVEMEICGHAECYVGDWPDCVYAYSHCVLVGPGDEYYYAKIPPEHIWPLADPKFTQAPEPLPATCYYKRPNLLGYKGTDNDHHYFLKILNEAEVCEILRNHPHPNIARYIGCIIKDGRIKGLAFDKYPVTLYDMLENMTPFDKDRCMSGIEAGVRHLHDLGLVHNDLNPANIMMDGDNPIIIDFDSCKPEGEKLLKGGTPEWSTEESYSKRSNDHYSLSKIREALFGCGEKYEADQKGEETQEVK